MELEKRGLSWGAIKGKETRTGEGRSRRENEQNSIQWVKKQKKGGGGKDGGESHHGRYP